MNNIYTKTKEELIPIIKELYNCLFDPNKKFTSLDGFEDLLDEGIKKFKGVEGRKLNFTYKGKAFELAIFNYIRDNGNTLGIRNGDTDSNFIQYVLDKHIQISENNIHFVHDAVVTGSSGKTRNACLDYIEKNGQHLVNQKIIDLGTLQIGYKFEDIAFQNLIAHFLEYSILRNDFKNDLSSNGFKNFYDLIDAYKAHIEDYIVISDRFEIIECHRNWVWILDNIDGLDDSECHYEIITRDKKSVSVEIHFETQRKKYYFDKIGELKLQEAEWTVKHTPNKSIAYSQEFSYNDPNLFEKIDNALLYLHKHLGNKIRRLKHSKYTIQELEKLFEEYLERVIPKSKSLYLSDMTKINEIGKRIKQFDESVYEIQDLISFDIFYNELEQDDDYLKTNKKRHNSPQSSLKKYKSFLKGLLSLSVNESPNDNNMNLNQILYGPPGTGKTYNTINKSLKIINDEEVRSLDWNDRTEVKELFEKKVSEGQIVFTTFHQSMSYEDFIEGIKPLKPELNDTFIKYDIKPGIFKNICNSAKKIKVETFEVDWDTPRYFKMSLGGKNKPDVHEWCIDNEVIALGYGGDKDLSKYKNILNWEKFRDEFTKEFPELVEESKYNIQAAYSFLNMRINDIVVISKGNHIIDAIGIIKGDYYWDDKNPLDYFHYRKVEWIAKDLHTNPDRFFEKQISQMTIYEFYSKDVKKEAFKEITKISTTNDKNYVLIIDEINRGNVSQIFGELITLIEEDKRLGKDEALEVTLPYSNEKFGVPSNLHIIGTMNTADRSVEALDTALRRRFCFEEIASNPQLIATEGKSKETQGFIGDIDLPQVLEIINQRIEALIGRDHKIGHAYFMKTTNLENLKETFKKNIIPLLQEYFYNDYEKIGLVLGQGFFEKPKKVDKSIFATFDTINYIDNSKIHHLKVIDENFDISQAIKDLIGKSKSEETV